MSRANQPVSLPTNHLTSRAGGKEAGIEIFLPHVKIRPDFPKERRQRTSLFISARKTSRVVESVCRNLC